MSHLGAKTADEKKCGLPHVSDDGMKSLAAIRILSRFSAGHAGNKGKRVLLNSMKFPNQRTSSRAALVPAAGHLTAPLPPAPIRIVWIA